MGLLHKINQKAKAEKAKTKAYKLSKEIQRFYSTHLVSPWQGERIKDIRALYEEKQKGLDMAHDHASSRLSEEFMQFELDYLYASDEFKNKNPGKEWTPEGVTGIFSKAFWKNMLIDAKRLGLNWNHEKEGAK